MGMGGGFGTILHMITTLKNNREAIPKSGLFRRKKDYFNPNYPVIAIPNDAIESKPLTEEQRKAIIEKIRRENRQAANKKTLYFISASILIILISLGIGKLIRDQQRVSKAEKESLLKEERIADYKKRSIEYTTYLKYGDILLNKEEYYMAFKQYELALSTDIDDQDAYRRLMNAYSLLCIKKNRGCSYTIYKLKELLSNYPGDMQLIHMLINCMEYTNDTTDLKTYYKLLNGSD
jgi:hypothetical protein